MERPQLGHHLAFALKVSNPARKPTTIAHAATTLKVAILRLPVREHVNPFESASAPFDASSANSHLKSTKRVRSREIVADRSHPV